MNSRNRWRLLVLLLVVVALALPAAHAKKIKMKGFATGPQDPELLNAGLPKELYGYHPSNDGSWGESWSLQAINEAGDQIFVILSISNYNPLHKFTGTADLFYVTADGRKYNAHQEFKKNDLEAAKDGVDVEIGGHTLKGEYPDYKLKMEFGDMEADLRFHLETPDYRLGNGEILFGDKGERYWSLTILMPRAEVTGTLKIEGKEIPFHGTAYGDHGWATVKIYKFSRWWYVVKILEDDFSMTAVKMIMQEDYEPTETQVIHMTLGDKVIVNSDGLRMKASGRHHDPVSGVTMPDSYKLFYDDGNTKLTGTVQMTELGEGINVLNQLSPFVRKLIQALVTEPWQFRYKAKADLTFTHNGETRQINGLALGEVHHYK